jgi:hypothetical protein
MRDDDDNRSKSQQNHSYMLGAFEVSQQLHLTYCSSSLTGILKYALDSLDGNEHSGEFMASRAVATMACMGDGSTCRSVECNSESEVV